MNERIGNEQISTLPEDAELRRHWRNNPDAREVALEAFATSGDAAVSNAAAMEADYAVASDAEDAYGATADAEEE